MMSAIENLLPESGREASTSKGAIALLIVLTGSVAWAQPAAPSMQQRLDAGLAEFARLEYEKAIRTLQPLRRDPTATRSQRLSALEVIGISLLILGDHAGSTEAFQDLLAIDPGYQLQHDDGSPKIREHWDQVRRRYVPGFDPEARVQLQLGAPSRAVAGRRVEVETEVLSGRAAVVDLVVRWRRRGVLGYGEAKMRRVRGGLWRARFVPPASPTGYVLDYYIEARNAAGGSIGRVGGPENPLGLSLAPGGRVRQSPWYKRWYVIAGGAAAVGMGTAALIFAGSRGADSGSLEPGRVTLTP
jgi:hypothetical protein